MSTERMSDEEFEAFAQWYDLNVNDPYGFLVEARRARENESALKEKLKVHYQEMTPDSKLHHLRSSPKVLLKEIVKYREMLGRALARIAEMERE